jgi:hypothetical protein
MIKILNKFLELIRSLLRKPHPLTLALSLQGRGT